MNILIKKPEVGEIVHSPISGITGKVVRLVTFQEAFGWHTKEELMAISGTLIGDLGENYQDRYFEAVIAVDSIDEGSEHRVGDEVVIDWEEYQNCNLNLPT